MRACLIIPVYNHADAIGRTVEALRQYGLTIYLVDDGSNLRTQQRLTALAMQESLVRLLRLPENQGKGAAVMFALRQAIRDGFSHALQIDADGQHDTADVPRFLSAAAAAPDAVVCGQPIYDRSVPKARLYGRYLTHVWVWVETLSFAVKDSMCGYRLYPLALTARVLETARIPTRMDFDPAILVRLVWAGAPIINVRTRVTYPQDGISHFDMLRDNLRITRMHTTLVFGMLRRLPELLARKWALPAGSRRSAHWARLAEHGSDIGLSIVSFFYRFFGRTAARALLYPITAYFFMASRRTRTASYDYLCRLYAHTGPTPALREPPSWMDCWRHLLAFAQSSLDKLAAWHGDVRHTVVDFPNSSELNTLITTRRGAVLIGAHLGNWEMSRAVGHFRGYRKVNALVYTEHARRFNSMLARANKDFAVNLIPVSTIGPETAVMLQEKIDNGELLVIVGDRTPPGEGGRIVRVPFLGAEASFAQGPFILASLLRCPVYLFFCLPEGSGYRVHFEHFADQVTLPRQTRSDALREYVKRYAEKLELLCAQAPYQWFNFYDFWAGAPLAPNDPRTKPNHELRHTKPGRA